MTRVAERRWIPAAAAAALLVLMVAVSPDFGATWDERFQQHYGEQIWDYLHGRIPRSDFDTDLGNQYLYGGLVDLICVALQRATGGDLYVVRHAVIAVFGWVGIVFAGLLAGRLWGARAGWIAALLLAASPRYFGDSMNNPKDLPFAALTAMALYYILTISPRPPYLTWGHAAKLAGAIALAINVRQLGVVLIGFAAFVLLLVAAPALWRQRGSFAWRALGAAGLRLAAVAVVAIPLGTLAWPWAQARPFTRPIQAFFTASSFSWGNPSLFAGRDIASADLPWYYLPTWLAIGLPAVVIAGACLSTVRLLRSDDSRLPLVALWTFVLLPSSYAVIRNVTLYDGMRHMFFIVPPIVVAAAAGWEAMLASTRRWVALAATAAFVVGVAEPVLFQLRNHPNQNVYFSPLVGGPRGAFGRFEMDYWGNCMLPAVGWAAEQAQRAGMPVVVTANAWEVAVVDMTRFPELAFRQRRHGGFHLDIRLLKGAREDVIGTSERPDVLHRVMTADGTPLCIVLPGDAYPQLSEQLEKRRRLDAQRQDGLPASRR